jgi:nickel-type superoxide dismutase maturation protease
VNHLPIGRLLVAGESMAPALAPGDRLIVLRGVASWRPAIRVGDLVAVADPRLPSRTMVKRVTGFEGSRVVVRGDNDAASTDSRHFGPVDSGALIGRVIYRYHPEHRRGWFRARPTSGGRTPDAPTVTTRALRRWKLPPRDPHH